MEKESEKKYYYPYKTSRGYRIWIVIWWVSAIWYTLGKIAPLAKESGYGQGDEIFFGIVYFVFALALLLIIWNFVINPLTLWVVWGNKWGKVELKEN